LDNYKNFGDEALIASIIDGEHAAFEEVFLRYNTILYNHAFNKLRNHEDAHDTVQDVFYKLWTRRDQLRSGSNLAGYLFTAIRNQIFDLIKHRKVVTAYEESFNSFASAGYLVTDHLVREKLFAALVEKEIAALPARMREVFELRRKESLSNKEIAQRLNIAESTVTDQMKKALKRLRTRLGMLSFIISNFI
jgi:RNA polymerase sigma-70 factor (family 1)